MGLEIATLKDDLTIEVTCRDLPGICFSDRQNPEGRTYEPVYLGIQKGDDVAEAVRADQKQVIFRPTFKVGRQPGGSPNFLGPFAKGTPRERFFYLCWGVVDQEGRFKMFRRAKIHLNHLKWNHLRAALNSNTPLKVVIDMTGHKGDPICGSIRIRKPMMERGSAKERDRADWQL